MDNEHVEIGVVVASLCSNECWDECWCGKERQDGDCRHCQTYQLYWGLGPTCDDNGKPLKRDENGKKIWSGERTQLYVIDNKLLEQQKEMRKKYKRT